MLDTDAVLKALKLYTTCPKSRLPEVVEMLKELGVNVPAPKVELNSKANHKRILALKRADQPTPKWSESNNEYVLLLREAYFKGISLVALARTVGLHKTTLYKYLYGDVSVSEKVGEQIKQAIREWESSFDE